MLVLFKTIFRKIIIFTNVVFPHFCFITSVFMPEDYYFFWREVIFIVIAV